MENITSIVSLIRADCGARADCRLMDTETHIRDSFHFYDARISRYFFLVFLPLRPLHCDNKIQLRYGAGGHWNR